MLQITFIFIIIANVIINVVVVIIIIIIMRSQLKLNILIKYKCCVMKFFGVRTTKIWILMSTIFGSFHTKFVTINAIYLYVEFHSPSSGGPLAFSDRLKAK
jgi:hypothetical protein